MTVLTDVKTRWDRVAQRLRAELGEDLYTSWFARMELEEFEQGRLIVSVPTRFLKSWIETHYVSKLHKISEAELGPRIVAAYRRAELNRRRVLDEFMTTRAIPHTIVGGSRQIRTRLVEMAQVFSASSRVGVRPRAG